MEEVCFIIFLFISARVSNAGKVCFGRDEPILCKTSCCGDVGNMHCCDSDVALAVGISLGIVGLVTLVISVVVVVFCCLHYYRNRMARTVQPTVITVTTTAPVCSKQRRTINGYEQVANTVVSVPLQLHTSSMSGPKDNVQKWKNSVENVQKWLEPVNSAKQWQEPLHNAQKWREPTDSANTQK